MKFLFIVFFLFLVSCSSTEVNSEGGKHSIVCMNRVSRCHDKARDICNDGYLVTNRVRPRKQGDDVQYTLNVRCRQSPGF